MSGTTVRAALLAALLAAPALADAPADYALRLSVPAAGEGTRCLRLPATVLASSRSPGLADIRLFDARGRALPIALRVPAPALRRQALAPLPVRGPADRLLVTGVSLRVDGDGQARIARVDGDLRAADPAVPTVLLGVLLDARRQDGAARALVLDMEAPPEQPVAVSVAASRDLSNWRPLGEATLYRRAGAPSPRLSVPLNDAALAGDWLRVAWRGEGRLLAPVAVRGAALLRLAPPAEATLEAATPQPADPRRMDVALPFAAPLASVAVLPGGSDLLVPFRLLGRTDREQPWTLLGTGVARRAGTTETVRLEAGRLAAIRIEADPRSTGFSAPPRLRLGFAARELLFAGSGAGPYALAVGKAGAATALLPSATLGQPVAPCVEPTAAAPRLTLAAPTGGMPRRQMLLWAVLLVATAFLAAMAWLLWRRAPAR